MNPTIDVGQWFFVFALFCGFGFMVMLIDFWLGEEERGDINAKDCNP